MGEVRESAGAQLARMGTDAAVWATEFARVARARGATVERGWLLDPAPGELLHVWFCNAIEAGRSAGYAEGLKAGTVREKLRWRWVIARHDFDRKVATPVGFTLAKLMPSWLRRYVVVQVTNEARRANPDPSGYAGPDGLGYRELYHAAERTPVPSGPEVLRSPATAAAAAHRGRQLAGTEYCERCQVHHEPPVAITSVGECSQS